RTWWPSTRTASGRRAVWWTPRACATASAEAASPTTARACCSSTRPLETISVSVVPVYGSVTTYRRSSGSVPASSTRTSRGSVTRAARRAESRASPAYGPVTSVTRTSRSRMRSRATQAVAAARSVVAGRSSRYLSTSTLPGSTVLTRTSSLARGTTGTCGPGTPHTVAMLRGTRHGPGSSPGTRRRPVSSAAPHPGHQRSQQPVELLDAQQAEQAHVDEHHHDAAERRDPEAADHGEHPAPAEHQGIEPADELVDGPTGAAGHDRGEERLEVQGEDAAAVEPAVELGAQAARAEQHGDPVRERVARACRDHPCLDRQPALRRHEPEDERRRRGHRDPEDGPAVLVGVVDPLHEGHAAQRDQAEGERHQH